MNIGKHARQPTSALITTDVWLHIFLLAKNKRFSAQQSSVLRHMFQ